MVFLAIAIICGSLFSIIFKYCQTHGIECNQVIFINYVAALIVGVVPAVINLVCGRNEIADYSIHGWTPFLAIVEGVLFVLGFWLMDHSVWRSGVALTMVSSKSSLLLPVILGWLVLDQPAPRILPVIIILISLLLIIVPAQNQKHEGVQLSSKTDAQRHRRTILDLIAVFLCFGVSDFGIKLSRHSVETTLAPGVDPATHLDSVMALLFLSASIVSLIVCFHSGSFKRSRLNLRNIKWGLILGVVNMCCTACMVNALGTMPTGVFYPIYNIGIVVVSTVIGVLVFKEHVKWMQFLGIALAIAAIVILFV